jgi:hypothetical protein
MIEPKEYKNKQGVYMIVQPDGKYYIGSSIELYNRLRSHKSCFSPDSRDYKKIEYTCDWSELNIYILKKTDGLNKSQIKKVEQKYLDLYWSDGILNTERKSTGRLIGRENNPNWHQGRCESKVCKCGSSINYRSSMCYSCRAKHRHSINKVDKNKRFI